MLRILALALCFVLLPGSVALAQSTPEERAKEFSAAGLEAVDKGDFLDAVAQFKKAYRTGPKPKYLFNVGRAYHVMGKFRLALEFYQRFLRETKSEKKAKRATDIVEELKRQMADLTVKVNIPDATVTFTVNGDPEACLIGTPCLLDPGEHRLEVGADGYVLSQRRLRLEAGEQRIETIELVAANPITRKGAVWRSALFPGMGQFYADKDTAAIFLAGELVSLSVFATGLILEQYYVGQRSKKGQTTEEFESWNSYIDASYSTWVVGLSSAGIIWAMNIVHAWAMPLSTTPTTSWQLVPTAGPNQAGLTFLLSF